MSQHHKEHCGECGNDWNCYCAEGPHSENVICDLCRASEDSEAERLKAMEWGGK